MAEPTLPAYLVALLECCGQVWAKAEPAPPLPAALVSLLVSLESVSPSLHALPPPADSWGQYFLDDACDSDASGGSRRELRLRIMSAIGNCRSLKEIDFNPLRQYGLYCVRDAEALALLNGLKRNPALESLSLCWIKGFGTTEACAALADAVLRHSRSLGMLDLRGLDMSVEGLGHISAALRDNSGSVLRELYLDGNEIGDAAGARHVAGILSNSRALEVFGMFGIGMDGPGAVLIADAVARSSTLDRIDIGYDLHKNPEQAAMLIPLLRALSCDESSSEEQSHAPSAAHPFNQSITRLWLEVTGLAGGEGMAGEAGLAEAVAAMLRSNTRLKLLTITSFFVTRGLSGLAHNSNIATLHLLHTHSVEDEELDPFLMEILQKCKTLEVLELTFMKPYGASRFTKEFFQGLKHNPSIRRLVLDGLDGWDGLDDEMFEDLIRSLSTNANLEHISIKGTSWQTQGKGERLAKTLRDARVVSLLVSLESVSPSLDALPPPAHSWGQYFMDDACDSDASGGSRRELRLRIMSAIGNCRSLKEIEFNPLGQDGLYCVRDVEALALLNGLKSNPALESLSLIKGFGTTEACAALADAVLRHSRSLRILDLRGLDLSVEGLGHISAALRDNSGSVLRVLFLDNNEIGDAAGARHVAGILSNSRALEVFGMVGIGMDGPGAVLIADAVARSSTLDRIGIGYNLHKDPEQAAMLIPLLRALSCDESSSEEQSHAPSAAHPFNQSITRLWLEVTGLAGGEGMAGEAGLAEAVAAMLRSNTWLKLLTITSFFVTRGLLGLAHNSNIATLHLLHTHSVEDEELDPFLMEILQKCKTLEVLELTFMKSYGASRFTKEFFQGLKHNPSIRRLVLDGWDGLDDEMFEDLIRSLSTNTNLEHISIKGTSWEKQGKGERLAKTLRDARVKQLPSQLLALLGDLESDSPALQQLPSVDLWGRYFDCECQDGECDHRGEWQWDVRLRLLTAIGKCRTLRKIQLNPLRKSGCRSVRQVEALALLSGLRDNIVLQELDLSGYVGFGGPAACLQALTAVIEKSFRSLDILGLQYVGLSVEGLGDIAAALVRNGSSVLSELRLCGNDIGNAVGAHHLTDILSKMTTLPYLWISNIGMDEEGAVLIAAGLAHSTTLTALRIGDSVPRNPNQAVPTFVIPLLEALVWHTPDQEKQEASNDSITQLALECPGGQQAVEPGLGEALACVLRSNRALEDLSLASFFVTRGLEALRENSSITKLKVFHRWHSEDDDMDPMLITILEECKYVQELQLTFGKPFGPSKFTKAFFQGLKHNPSIRRLVLDGWDGLDDEMFEDLFRSLSTNTNLEHISIKGTSWEKQGKGERLAKTLRDARVVSLLVSLESVSPSLDALPPPAHSWGQYFMGDACDSDASGGSRRELRLRIMSAIGNCRSLKEIDFNPLGQDGLYCVRDAEALALLNGLKRNPALESLSLHWIKGFGTTQACAALADAVLRHSRSLGILDLRGLDLSVEGLGHISAALRDNSGSVLRELYLDGNEIGDAAGARHVAGILSNSRALEVFGMFGIGMDGPGAVLIADAVARSSTLDRIDIGYDLHKNPEQAAMLIPLLRALSCDESSSEEQSHAPSAAHPFNQSITRLWLEVTGLAGGEGMAGDARLAEAVSAMLRSNTSLNFIRVTSFFVTRGLSGLAHNSNIATLQLVHHHSVKDEELDPCLMDILHKCKTLKVLQLKFTKSYGTSRFTKEFFQGLKHNPSIRRLVLDGWDGLDDEMFEDLIRSLSTNTNLEHISIKGTSWEKQGKRERLAKTLRDARVKQLPPQLLALLGDLESDSPALQQPPSVDLWGRYFDCECQDGECDHRGEWQWDVRLRLLTAIGKCRTLRKIQLNPLRKSGCRSVRQVEALALLSGLRDNIVLQELDLSGYVGFGGPAACLQALTAVIEKSFRSLDILGLQYVGLSVEGLGDIAAALGRNGSSVLSELRLCGNDIGNAVGAHYLTDILSNMTTLRYLWIGNIGMDEEGAVLIAAGLAHSTTLTALRIGDSVPRNPNQAVPTFVIPLLEALVWHTPDQEKQEASNHSITLLVLECPGGQQAVEPGLGEALACVLRSNRALEDLSLASFFVTRGLEALRENSSITKLHVFHRRHSEDDDMDPILITILEECKSVQELQLTFGKPFGPSKFTKAFFRGLLNNRSIKTLVLDDWDGLDDYMFQDLMRSLRPNGNNVLENISIKKTSWESEGKGIHIQNALTRNIQRRSSGLQGSEQLRPLVMSTMATSSGDAGKRKEKGEPVPVSEELLALLAELESPSPTLSRLPRVDSYGQLFRNDVEHPKAESELRLRLMTAIGKCPTLISIELDPLGRRNYRVTVAEATAFLEGLSSNAVVERLNLSGYSGFGTGAACTALAATVRSSRTLQFLNMGYTGMTPDGLSCIAAALRENRSSVLFGLNLSGNAILGGSARSLYLSGDTIIESGGAEHLADIITSTRALRGLAMWNIGMDEAGALKVGKALAQNTTLQYLFLGFERGEPQQAGVTATLLARSLTPGMRDAEQEAGSVALKPPSANESITQLRLYISGSGQEPIDGSLGEAVARMLRANTTLKHFDLSSCLVSRGLEGLCDNSSIIHVTVRQNNSSHNDDYSKLMPILQRCQSVESLQLAQNSVGSCNLSKMFFRSLQTNRYLKKLELDDWKGLDDDMFQELMQALQVNTNLESISLENTAWKRQGKGAAVDEVLRQNREYRRALAGVPTMPVKSCRLVLCGFPYAGKTTIRNTLIKMETHEEYAEMEGTTIWEEIPRTLGFEVKVIKDAPALRITVWDLAGHREYHALHDFVFPNVNNSSVFLFVYNPFKCGGNFSSTEMKDRKDFREEFIYWLKFIASNSKLGQQVKPYVHVIVTFRDKVQGDMHSLAICEEMSLVKRKFRNLVETAYEPTFINGQSWKDVSALRISTEKKLQQLVSKLAPVPNICEQTRVHVQRWAKDQQGTPIISIEKFSKLFHMTCKVALEHPFISEDYKRFLLDFMGKEDSWKVVASYLKDSGEIIYFERSGLMVLNLQWLGMGVFGQLIGLFGKPDGGRDWLQVQNGFISKYGLGKLLKMSLNKVELVETIVSEEQFIQLLLELHLCYESRDGEGQVRYFIPICKYREGDIYGGVNQQLEWPSHDDDPNDYIFIGLRLQCDDQDCTFLTPGFFPRLQVLLYTYCLEKGWVDEDVKSIDSAIKLQPNVLLISVESLDIFIEFNAEVGCYVDILARSDDGYLRTLLFLQEHIVSQIRSFCASYEGCAGVTLVEGVLRRECVVSLTLCRYRKHQCILTDRLIKEVAATKEKGYAHYTQSWRAISTSTQGQPPVLKANKEYATVVDGHIILARKGDLARAEAESEGSKSKNSSFSGGTPTQLSPQVNAVQKVQHIAGSYPNHSVEAGRRRGLAVIVSMEEDRPGGAVDRGRLEALLKNLAFDTDIVVNQSENVKAYLRRLAKLPTLANDDCFLCCINAHGGIDEDGRQYILISGAGGEKLYVDDDILKPISESRSLANKPKVFVINACRGRGHLITSQKAEDSEVEKSQVVSKRAGEVRALHSVSDCLIVFSTSHGQQSFRDTEEGTNFITALMDAIVQGSQTADVLSILTSVIGKVTEREVKVPSQAGKPAETKFQCPEFYSTLTKGLYWSSP